MTKIKKGRPTVKKDPKAKQMNVMVSGATQDNETFRSRTKYMSFSAYVNSLIDRDIIAIILFCCLFFSCKTQSINPTRYEITYSNGVSRVVNNWHFRTDAIRGGSVHVVKVTPCPEN